MPVLKGSAAEHPCFSAKAHGLYGRIHLPVAPRCNLQCVYCDRRFDCPNESRPGVTSALLDPKQALRRVQEVCAKEPRIRVVGVAGPGEPLANEETFCALRLVHEQFPHLTLCVSTNGLLLPEKLNELLACGVKTLTVTLNAFTQRTAKMLYSKVQTGGAALPLDEGVALLLERQKTGVKAAAKAGLTVKINTVLVPGVNDEELEAIAKTARHLGASIMNIMPLIPCGTLSHWQKPSTEALMQARKRAGAYLPQFTHCKQCRADACGVPGEE